MRLQRHRAVTLMCMFCKIRNNLVKFLFLLHFINPLLSIIASHLENKSSLEFFQAQIPGAWFMILLGFFFFSCCFSLLFVMLPLFFVLFAFV